MWKLRNSRVSGPYSGFVQNQTQERPAITNTIILHTVPILVAIDLTRTRHKVLIDVSEKKCRRHLTILNQRDDFRRLIATVLEYIRPDRVKHT